MTAYKHPYLSQRQLFPSELYYLLQLFNGGIVKVPEIGAFTPGYLFYEPEVQVIFDGVDR